MPSPAMVVEGAIHEAGSGERFPSDKDMVAFFTEAKLAPPTEADLKKFHTMSSNVLVGGISIAWCGIFACYVLKHWGGYDCKWIPGNTGIKGDGITKSMKPAAYKDIRPGDVCVILNNPRKDKEGKVVGYLDHHYIVTAIDYAANTHSFVEGNGFGNKIWHRENKPIEQPVKADNYLKRPYCVYRLPR